MTTNDNEKLVKFSNKYFCEKCNYTTCRKYNLLIHNESIKHKNNILTTKNNGLLVNISKTQKCLNCNKEFNDRAGLWRHKKKCINTNNENTKYCYNNKEFYDKAVIMSLINDNKELKHLMLEICKEKDEYKSMMMEQQNNMLKVLENGTNNNNTTNSHNKSFNLNFFLNETCKDAMNIMDFVDSIKLQLSDLEKVGEIGFVDGISNIIVKKLKDLDVTKRPVHCTDKKREVLYVKDENKWEKEGEENKKVRRAIKSIANKNIKMLSSFKDTHPDCLKSESHFSDKYNKLVIESFGGAGNEDYDNENKIIKKISREVIIVERTNECKNLTNV